ncbi:hypothetical protein LGM63_31755 [Burkholderia cepacia]|uniref:hypothetical protein n=1 Tax=Burkholderia cepacia TaxID=292 RepID=UPI0007C7E5E7|nr:hypothetical protein [Burkholderia cepacia]MCA7995233.1 hypothetical protein [Burkholderia cepacia]CAG9257139.1 hypothetical protein BCEP4_1820011 [Burkholderia cepacia]
MLDSLVSELEVAADTLSAADANQMWAQLQAIARMLKSAGCQRRRPGSKTSSANGPVWSSTAEQ